MDFTDAVVFAGAIVAIVGSGILLGVAIGRSRRQTPPPPNPEKAQLYGQILVSLDGLRMAQDDRKQRFIELYYALLIHGSDQVIRSINTYLQNATAEADTFDSSVLAASRDQVAIAMRQDVQWRQGLGTTLSPQELYSIEISHDTPAATAAPAAPVPAAPPAPDPYLPPTPAEREVPEPRPVPRGY